MPFYINIDVVAREHSSDRVCVGLFLIRQNYPAGCALRLNYRFCVGGVKEAWGRGKRHISNCGFRISNLEIRSQKSEVRGQIIGGQEKNGGSGW